MPAIGAKRGTVRTCVGVVVGGYASLSLLLGCAHNVQIPDPAIRTPLIDPLPLTMAISYSDKLQTWNETLHAYGDTLVFPLGRPSVEWLNLALKANFEQVVVFDHPPTAAEMEKEGASALLVVSPEKFDFSVTATRLGASYHLVLSDRNGIAVAEWTVHGQFDLQEYNGIRPTSKNLGEAGRVMTNTWGVVGEHTALAIRDAASQIAVGLREQPEVHRWLEEHQQYRPLVGISDRKEADDRYSGNGPVLLVGDDGDVLQCMRHALENHTPPIQVTSPWDLRDSLFPWFENKRIAPQGAKTTALRLRTIAQSEHGSRRLQEVALRYVIEVSNDSEVSGHGFILPTYYGFYGIAWGDRKNVLNAAIGDLSDATVTDMRVKREGKWAVPAFIFPVPLVPPTEHEACQDLGAAIGERLQSIGQQQKQ